MGVSIVMTISLRQPIPLLLHWLMRMTSFFVSNLTLLFVTVLVITVDDRMRNVPMQYLRKNGDAKGAYQEATHQRKRCCFG